MSNFDFTFYAHQHLCIRIRNRSFDEAIKLAHGISDKIKPLVKMVFQNGDVLYFDDHIIQQYIDKEITYQELINQLKCNDVIINKSDFTTDNGVNMDQGGLWKRFNNKCILIDEDHYVECNYMDNLFESVESQIN